MRAPELQKLHRSAETRPAAPRAGPKELVAASGPVQRAEPVAGVRLAGLHEIALWILILLGR